MCYILYLANGMPMLHACVVDIWLFEDVESLADSFLFPFLFITCASMIIFDVDDMEKGACVVGLENFKLGYTNVVFYVL